MKTKILLFLILILFIPLSTATPTTIEMHPSEISVNAGEYFNISFIVKPSETINTVATDRVYWEVGTLECVKISQGYLFPDTVMFLGGEIDNDKGEIKNIVWASHDRTNTTGVFINMTFRAIKGETWIIIDPTKFGVANDGVALEKEISNSCAVKVIGEAEPTTNNNSTNSLNPQLYILLIFLVLLIISTILLLYFIKKRKKKSTKEEQKEEQDNTLFY